MEDSQESRLINPKPITHNPPQVFFLFFLLMSWYLYVPSVPEVGVQRRLTWTLGAYRYGRCAAASRGKTSKDVFLVFFMSAKNVNDKIVRIVVRKKISLHKKKTPTSGFLLLWGSGWG